MSDLWAIGKNPCALCRGVVAIVALSGFSIFSDHGVANSDFFGLRHYAGVHIPPAVDSFLTFLLVAAIWILCERVIVGYFICSKPARGDDS